VGKEERLRELIAEWAPSANQLEQDAVVYMFLSYIDAVNSFEGHKTE
jgi:hypothetical protein